MILFSKPKSEAGKGYLRIDKNLGPTSSATIKFRVIRGYNFCAARSCGSKIIAIRKMTIINFCQFFFRKVRFKLHEKRIPAAIATYKKMVM